MFPDKATAEQDGATVHGDVLEEILSHVPLIDLVSSSSVSKFWESSVSSSLSHFNPIKPWLFLHSQSKTPPFSITTHAYDPRSDIWMEITQPPLDSSAAALRSSHSSLLYSLSPSKLTLSVDPLHLTWHHVQTPSPISQRTDPIVAMVGDKIIIITGGTCGFIEDHQSSPAVEIYDMNSKTWDISDSMPPRIFMDCASSTWVSTAVLDHEKLFIMQKNSGVTFSFNPLSKSWSGPYCLKPDENMFSSVIGFVEGRLILIGLLGSAEDVESVKIWEFEGERLEGCKEIGEMPKLLVEKMKGESGEMRSIGMVSMADFVFIYHNSDPVEVIKCEVVENGDWRWGVLKNTVIDDRMRMRRLVFTSSSVGIGDLKKVMRLEDRRILIKY